MSRAARSSTNPRAPRTPAPPDRFQLYELAVQAPDDEARFLRALHAAPHEQPLVLGEDFSGAGAVARAWVRLFPGARAVCVDADAEPLTRLLALAPPDGSIVARCCDVLEARDKVDIIADFNFSICERTSRPDLLSYLRHARSRLRPGGVLAVDLYGGADAFIRGESAKELRSQELGGVRYVWEQREADATTGLVVNAMHFSVPVSPGSRRRAVLRDAFIYRWRLWSIPEMRDAMTEAGFTSTEVHDRLGGAIDSEGRVHARALGPIDDLDDNYVAYVVARVGRRRGARGR